MNGPGSVDSKSYRAPAGKLTLNPEAPSVSGSNVDVVFAGFPVPIPVDVLPVGSESATVQIGGPGSIVKVLEIPVDALAKVAWAKDGRSASYETSVKLEKLSELIGPLVPGIGNAGGKLTAKLENGVGFVITQGEVKIDEIGVLPKALTLKKQLKLRDILLRYEEREGRPFWTGQAGITFPVAKGEIGVTGKAFVVEGSLAGGGLAVTGINRRLGVSPLFLQEVSGDLLFAPKFGYNLAIKGSLGPRVKGKQLLAIEGSMVGGGLGSTASCTFGPDPARLLLSSKFTPLEPLIRQGLAATTMSMQSCVYEGPGVSMDVTGQMGFELAKGALAAESRYTGFVSPSGATMEGTGTIKVPLVPNLKGTVVASTVGLAACGSFGFFEGGFGYRWGGPPPATFRGCDLGPYRVVAKASSAGATASSENVRVAVPRGLPHAAFAVRGTTSAPRVHLVGPGGVSVSTPASGLLRNRSVVSVADRREKTTYVIVRSPQPGTWRVNAAKGGLSGVEFARGLPDPRVRARVLSGARHRKGHGRKSRRRRGRKLRLVYSVRRIPGQKVTFVERGEEIAKTIGVAKRPRGTILFRPGAGSDVKRTVEAEVVQDGLPRAVLTVAKFSSRAAAPKGK